MTRISWLCLLLLGLSACAPDRSAGPSDMALTQAFKQLHTPIYGVYDLGFDRDAVHDHLAASFRGEALTQEYVEHFTALARMRSESTAINILRVDYESLSVLERAPDRVSIDADWSVGGIVTHQQHRHPRTNRYRAVYDMAYGHDGWRLVGSRLRDMSRVRGFSSLGRGETWPLDDLPKSSGGLMSPLELLKAGMAEDLESARDKADTSTEEP